MKNGLAKAFLVRKTYGWEYCLINQIFYHEILLTQIKFYLL